MIILKIYLIKLEKRNYYKVNQCIQVVKDFRIILDFSGKLIFDNVSNYIRFVRD